MTTVSNGSLNSYSYAFYATHTTGGEKVAVPVKPSNVVYSQLDHISGYAAKGNQEGVTINRVHLLNTLIDQVVRINPETSRPANVKRLSNSQIDAMVQDYFSQISSAVNAPKTNPYALAPSVPQGMIVDIEV